MVVAVKSISQMRVILSVQYGGNWKDRLDKMSDNQVYAIYQRYLDKQRKREADAKRARTG